MELYELVGKKTMDAVGLKLMGFHCGLWPWVIVKTEENDVFNCLIEYEFSGYGLINAIILITPYTEA